ncbi:MAG: hypothetical protein IJV27_08335 [Prevotella sp.]|nr:hypothetical protein [Prevotella sp.]
MKAVIGKLWKPALTLSLAVSVFLFWRFGYPAALTYQEQFQLFLFGIDYFVDHLGVPGGLADYVAEFLVQFYNSVALGAVLIALLAILVQQLTYWLMVKECADRHALLYPLSFIPSFLLWFLMGDINIMPTFVVAVVFAMCAMLVCPRQGRLRLVYWFIAVLALYWLVGSIVLVFAVYVAIAETLNNRSRLTGIGWGIVVFGYAIACIIVSSHLVPYPLNRLFRGLAYYRFPEVLSYIMVIVAAIVAILPFVGRFLSIVSRKSIHGYIVGTDTFVLVALGVLLIPKGYDKKTYELIDYDFLVRVHDWDGIIAKAERQMPDLPMSVCATNLALGMKGQLGDRAFHFYQNGTQGLLPPFERNFTTLLVTAEAYWQLGLVNTAQRFEFESMESLPNYKKSCRIIRRLAETNLVNGQYAVAEKYLNLLEKTFFYARWSRRTKALLGHEKAINAHPLYGCLRRMRLTEDFLFSEDEADKIIGKLVVRNSDNMLAVQYLLLWPLLQRDINKFMNYMQFTSGHMKYNPQTCQEAIAFAYMTKNERPPRDYVSPLTEQSMMDFSRIYQNGGHIGQQLAAFRNTVWYYLMNIK